MTAKDCTLETRRRIWRHMFTSLLGVAAAIVVAGLAGGLASSLEVGILRSVLAGGAVVSALGLGVGVGFWSASKNLRCPGCDVPIWKQVSGRRSFAAAHASSYCLSCGVRLFDERSNRRMLALVLVAVALGMAGALFNIAMQR